MTSTRTRLAHRPAADTRGFILGYVLLMGFIVGALSFAYFTAQRHHDAQVRRGSDTHRARFLARSALEYLRYALREELLRNPPSSNPDTENGRFLEFLLQDAAELEKRWRKLTEKSPDDQRDLLVQFLGREPVAVLDRLEKELPQASVSVTFDLDAAPLVRPLAPDSGIVDAVLKKVEFRLVCKARVRKASASYAIRESLRIHHTLPEGGGRFTMVGLDLTDGDLNATRVTERGRDAGGGAPIVLIHSPTDGDPESEDPFAPGAPKGPMLTGDLPEDRERLHEAFAGRGLVYLANADLPVRLNLASGEGPLGEYHTVYTVEGKAFYPVAQTLEEQPPGLESFLAPDTREPGVFQTARVQGATFGFYDGFGLDVLPLGPISPDEGPKAATLRLYGTSGIPSATLVYGRVYRTFGAISDLAIDRDSSGNDEADQALAVGVSLPERDAIDPFLRHADEATFVTALQHEAGGRPPLGLVPFNTPGLPPYNVVNVNLRADTDGDGVPDRLVPTEVTHSPIRLSRQHYRYGGMFAGYGEYQRYMSKLLDVPANAVTRLSTSDPASAQTVLSEIAFGKPETDRFEDHLLKDLVLTHRSALHKSMETRVGHRNYLDSTTTRRSDLDTTLVAGIPGNREVVFVEGQDEFMRKFVSGGGLDLQGLEVRVVGERPGEPGRLELTAGMNVKSGGVLQAEELITSGIRNPGQGVAFSPLILRCSRITIKGPQPVEAQVVTTALEASGGGDRILIRGNLIVRGPATRGLDRPLIVAWDPRLDPTSPLTAAFYRGRFEFNPARHEWVDGS